MDTSSHPNFTSKLMLLTPLLKGSEVPMTVPRYESRTFTATREQFALPVATSDSYGYQQELNPGSLGASQLP